MRYRWRQLIKGREENADFARRGRRSVVHGLANQVHSPVSVKSYLSKPYRLIPRLPAANM
ncbi:hypothetical protein BHYA_0190g00100 [Botrytis hyacinthi]|uniref:Uncharacterized protein n=1 Tax=Botrytis hyacinthi TaxID=278943 RepID=A0A4Z1GGN3_9HELO|nr:hypothetical protein BHYA_0190g00100 [Botrytis hyacinthi]